ncbi:HD domain-containing phosphohydrolase [Chloroflexota bacterium]
MNIRPEQILIVDDEEGIRRLLHRKLSSLGYQCQEAGSAEQALETLRSKPPELVLLDIRMPGKPGNELLPEIKAKYPDITVIMVTAITDTSIAIQCIRQGAYDYITKPFNLDEVVLSVARAQEKRRLELENREYQQHLEQKVEEQAKRIRTSFLNALTALTYALEANDRYTSGHSQRVSKISVATAKGLGVSQDGIEKIRLAGLIHDIGKIGIKESILNKPGRVTDEEYQHIKSHPEVGARILIPIVKDDEILEIVAHHHERYDGAGYPDGLSGEQIPLGARILIVADSYDAMTSERPYRSAIDVEKACAEIERCKGSQFVPEVADTFLKIRESVHSVVSRYNKVQHPGMTGEIAST